MNKGFVSANEGLNSATIEFFHPKSNAMSSFLLDELSDKITELGKRSNLNTILLKSSGDVFCAGAYFDELLAVNDLAAGERFFMGFAKLILAMKTAKPLVVIAVQGKAIGGAVGMIAAADYVIASSKALVRLSELSIGIGPFVISPVIKSKVTNASFMQLALNPKNWFDCSWCFEKGLFNQVVDPSALNSEVENKIQELSMYNTEAIHALKLEGDDSSLDKEMLRLAKISGELVTSAATKQILKTFISK